MWLLTSIGFFSVVCKPEDCERRTLTVRARIRCDLETLRDRYLPSLDEIQESELSDYRYRAVVLRADFARALGRLALELDYPNFKAEVARRQGLDRAALYEEVWRMLAVLAVNERSWLAD